MTFRFILFCEEEENFVVELLAPPSTTFLELHNLIQEICGYKEHGNHRFLLCNEDWKVNTKIHLYDVASVDLDEDIYLMKDTSLEDFIEEERQHFAYIYDTDAKRTFLIELVEEKFGEKEERLRVGRMKGSPPSQFLESPESFVTDTSSDVDQDVDGASKANEFDETCVGDEDIDLEGFEVTEI